MFGAPAMLVFGTFIEYVIVMNWTQGQISTAMVIYMVDVIVLIVCLLSAAWIAVKSIAAAIDFVDGFAFNYRKGSLFGDMIGGLEVAAFGLYLATSLLVTVTSLIGASLVWYLVDERVVEVKEKGIFGVAVSVHDAIKFCALSFIVALGVAISAWSMGDTVDELVGWFDEWSDPASNDSKQEGRDKNDPSIVDTAGTSLYFDYGFHITTLIYSWFGFMVIMTGATIFGFVFMWPQQL